MQLKLKEVTIIDANRFRPTLSVNINLRIYCFCRDQLMNKLISVRQLNPFL